MVLITTTQFVNLLRCQIIVIENTEVPYDFEESKMAELKRLNDLIEFHSDEKNVPINELTSPFFLSAN